jgi:hypothetical protein
MALSKKISIDVFGKAVDFDGAYIKVAHISGTKDDVLATVDMLTAKDGQIVKQGKYQFKPSLDGSNFIKQSYEHLKTLEEFSGAVDS